MASGLSHLPESPERINVNLECVAEHSSSNYQSMIMSGIVVKLYLDSDESSDLEDWTGEAASAGVSRMAWRKKKKGILNSPSYIFLNWSFHAKIFFIYSIPPFLEYIDYYEAMLKNTLYTL